MCVCVILCLYVDYFSYDKTKTKLIQKMLSTKETPDRQDTVTPIIYPTSLQAARYNN